MTVREECKRRFGDKPCIPIYAADMVTEVDRFECVDWCPMLSKRLDQEEPEGRDAA